jgi:hypothetical protein
MVLVLIQPLKEVSTRKCFLGVKRGRRVNSPPADCLDNVGIWMSDNAIGLHVPFEEVYFTVFIMFLALFSDDFATAHFR